MQSWRPGSSFPSRMSASNRRYSRRFATPPRAVPADKRGASGRRALLRLVWRTRGGHPPPFPSPVPRSGAPRRSRDARGEGTGGLGSLSRRLPSWWGPRTAGIIRHNPMPYRYWSRVRRLCAENAWAPARSKSEEANAASGHACELPRHVGRQCAGARGSGACRQRRQCPAAKRRVVHNGTASGCPVRSTTPFHG